MKFELIDQKNWKRSQMFYYFSRMAPTGYSLTVTLDVTRFRHTLKEAGLKFFPAYLWLITRNLNKQMEFKVAVQDERLGYFDKLTPLYASFHEDDKTFSLMWTEYQECFTDFYEAYINNQLQYGTNHGVLCQPLTPPPANAYTVSCLPWVSFDHFAVHSFEKKDYYFPSVESGKFFEEDGCIRMPLSMTCHHATTDGYHVHLFLKELQQEMDSFQDYI